MNASSSLAKRAAAVAASGWTKLLVRNSASEFSPHWVRGRPSRTARVSRRTSSGNSTRGRRLMSPVMAHSDLFRVALQGQARAGGVLVVLLRGAALRLDGL